MFTNIGKKIKVLAQIFCWLGIVASIVVGAIANAQYEDWGETLMLVGPIVSWISSWMLYGFGEAVDKLCDIERHMRFENNGNFRSEVQVKEDDHRLRELESLRAQGLINEEEYRQAVTKQ